MQSFASLTPFELINLAKYVQKMCRLSGGEAGSNFEQVR